MLSGFEEIPVAVAYRLGDQRFTDYPAHLPSLDGLEVELEHRPGWSEDLSDVRSFEDLPENARAYVDWVEEQVGTPVVMVSVGPERGQVVPRPGESIAAAGV